MSNELACELLRDVEGCRLKAYQDVGGVWTIGYGDTGPWVRPGTKISQQEAEGRLMTRVQNEFGPAIDQMVKVPLEPHQRAALISWAYNVGLGAAQRSTLIRKLNEGDYDAVPVELRKWKKASGRTVQGLINRREKEVALWLGQSWQV